MAPIVSVCIPAYRAERFIDTAIGSVLTQTYDDFELVVVDDASPDGTFERAAASADSRVRLHRNERNLGAAANWDRAVELSSGRYLKILCSDDSLSSRCLERQVAVLETEPDVVLVSAQRDIVDGDGRVLLRARGIGRLAGTVDGRRAIRATVRAGTNLIGEPSAALVRRDALVAAGPFDPAASYMVDLDMWCRVLEGGAFHGIAEPLATFRVSSASWSAELTREQAGQARAFFRRLRERGLVSRLDALIGMTRATALASARRVVFRRASRRAR